jgi:hypothetical protein
LRSRRARKSRSRKRLPSPLIDALTHGARKMPEIHRLEEFQALRGYEPFEAILRPKG